VSDSRYIKYTKVSLPKEKRTVKYWGAESPGGGWLAGPDQSNILFKCWNCGFICNTDRDQLGDGVGYVVVDEVRVKPFRLGTGDIKDLSLSIGDFQSGCRLFQLDALGDPVTINYNFTQKVFAGCPSCGSKNYK
jgi:hypothetical protein